MKKVFVLIALIAATAIALLTACATSNQEEKSQTATNSIMGTWQLNLYKYGSGTSTFTESSANIGIIKLITDTHFTWIHFDKTTKKVFSSAGGTYTLTGNIYTESIDFGLGMDSYLGNKPAYTIKVEGDMLFLSGDLTEGFKIEEVWQRIR